MMNPEYRPTARTSEEGQETPKTNQQTVNGVPVWSKAFLITFWVFQLIICLVGWGVGALAFGTKSILDDDDYSYSHNVDFALRYINLSSYHSLTAVVSNICLTVSAVVSG